MIYGLFYRGDTARETILRTASRMRRIIKRGFLTIFGKLTADGWILPNAPVPWKKQSAVLHNNQIFPLVGYSSRSPDHLFKFIFRNDGDTERTRLVELASGRLARKDKRRLF